MENNAKVIQCNQCKELIVLDRFENIGKCLRDSMYKDPQHDNCMFGQIKHT